MVASRAEGETFRHFDSLFYHDQINKVIQHILPQFDKLVKKTVYFHLFFILLIISQAIAFSLFLGFLIDSRLVAVALGGFFLTLFSYLILRIWLNERRKSKFQDLVYRYLKSCKHLLNYNPQIPEHLVELGNACGQLASSLTGKEYSLWKAPRYLSSFYQQFERFSCFWHWKDILLMKELVLQASVDEHVKLVRCEPTSLEVHAGLANAYVMLSSVYQDPKEMDDRWIPEERYSEKLAIKFQEAAQKAVEEFKILSEFAPDDPWVHVQLALSYHDLKMSQDEIREYEAICKLCPQDKDALFKLGVLYFEQGDNALGLKVFENLRRLNYQKAEQLIEFYGQCQKKH